MSEKLAERDLLGPGKVRKPSLQRVVERKEALLGKTHENNSRVDLGCAPQEERLIAQQSPLALEVDVPNRQHDRRPFSNLHSQDRARRLRLDSGPLQQIEQLGLLAIRRRDCGARDPEENANYLRPMPAAQSEEPPN